MTKYIDADALREDWLENGENEHIYDTNDFLNSIDDAPAADVVEVVHAQWAVAKETESEKLCYCTRCGWLESFSGFRSPELYRLCPSCGAKMDGEES